MKIKGVLVVLTVVNLMLLELGTRMTGLTSIWLKESAANRAIAAW